MYTTGQSVAGFIFTHEIQFWLGVVPVLLGFWLLKRFIFD